jgi:hypothetical protein
MPAWKSKDLTRIADSEEITVTATNENGSPRKPVTIWVVRDGHELYVRSYKGRGGAWYQSVSARPQGRVNADGVENDVTFTVVDDEALNDTIDAAYRAKYQSHGAEFVGPMTNDEARGTTRRLEPR